MKAQILNDLCRHILFFPSKAIKLNKNFASGQVISEASLEVLTPDLARAAAKLEYAASSGN